MPFLSPEEQSEVALDPWGGSPSVRHLFDPTEILAINAALASQRPLLVRGEPGTGKSQLARAAAKALGWAFVSHVVEVRTEARDLRWTFDAVRRLGDAQVAGVHAAASRGGEAESAGPSADFRDEGAYVRPGPLWWAFDWASAKELAAEDEPPRFDGCSPKNGVVLLLDEIDKADSSVPNGLLEALGDQRFPRVGGEPVVRGAAPLLTVITTNEERSLPDAFLRRCLVLQLRFPEANEARAWLMDRGRAHFTVDQLDEDTLGDAADLLIQDRAAVEQLGFPPPGAAEYLDLLRALEQLKIESAGRQKLMKDLGRFFFRKHPEPRRR